MIALNLPELCVCVCKNLSFSDIKILWAAVRNSPEYIRMSNLLETVIIRGERIIHTSMDTSYDTLPAKIWVFMCVDDYFGSPIFDIYEYDVKYTKVNTPTPDIKYDDNGNVIYYDDIKDIDI